MNGLPRARDVRRLARLLVVALLAAGAAPADGPGAAPRAAAERPNVVLIVVDTLRSDQLSSYAADAPPTPAIDRLAAEGVRFVSAYSAAPWTAPSLVSIMTGLPPSTHGVYAYPDPAALAEAHVTLAELLKARGYATAAFTEGGYAKPGFGLGQGFDHYPSHAGDERSNFGNLTSEGRLEENLARTLAWLGAAPRRPFFLFFHTYAPHYPYNAPAELLERPVPLPAGDVGEAVRAVCGRWGRGEPLGDADAALVVRNLLRFGEHALRVPHDDRCMGLVRRSVAAPTTAVAQALGDVRVLYRAGVRNADRAVGRLLGELDARGLAGESVVLLTSDHGEGLGEHGAPQHGVNLHRELLQVPLLLRVPGHPARGRSIPGVVRTIDVLPTLAALAGAEVPKGVQGESLLPLLSPAAGEPRTALGEGLSLRGRERSLRSLRTADWALIREESTGRVSLYDVRGDPRELADLVSSRAEVARRLGRSLADSFAAAERAALRPAAPQEPALTEEELRALGYLN